MNPWFLELVGWLNLVMAFVNLRLFWKLRRYSMAKPLSRMFTLIVSFLCLVSFFHITTAGQMIIETLRRGI